MKTGQNYEEIESVVKVLRQYPEIELAIVYGSLALGNARSDSDLDLALVGNKPLPLELKAQLIGELALVTGRPIDLVDLRTAGQPLLSEIITKGKRILGSPETFAYWMVQHLIEQEDFAPILRRLNEERLKRWTGT
jgi:predicted nucleotidyltransferase